MLLLQDGKTGEAWKPSKKAALFQKFGSTGQKFTFTFHASKNNFVAIVYSRSICRIFTQ
jgi:hypothetical protein